MNSTTIRAPRATVSIICVSNNEEVLDDCLRRSVLNGLSDAPQTELIVLDNREQTFSMAGAALNEGVRRAHNDVCVMVHQDVYLHSLPDLERAAARLMADPELGVMGAIGIDHDGILQGQIRDRLVLSGKPLSTPRDVDSLDEVLLMATRQQLTAEPLSEDPQLAWHAYGVEYGARMRRKGHRVVAADIALTHNSLTINLAKLSEAHDHVGKMYPEFDSIITTCGTIGAPPRRTLPRFIDSQRWRLRWLRGSLALYRALGGVPAGRTILSDIRFTLDGALQDCNAHSLAVVNIGDDNSQTRFGERVTLLRLGREISFQVFSPTRVNELLVLCEREKSILVTNADAELLARCRDLLGPENCLQGFDASVGHWLLAGEAARAQPDSWSHPAAQPSVLLTRIAAFG